MASATMKQQQLPYSTATAAASTEDDDHSSSSSGGANATTTSATNAAAAAAAAAAATLSANFNHHQLLMSYQNRHSDYYQQHHHGYDSAQHFYTSANTQMGERAHQQPQALTGAHDVAAANRQQQHQHDLYQQYSTPSGYDPNASYHTSYASQYPNCQYDTSTSQQYQQQVYEQTVEFGHHANTSVSANSSTHFEQQYDHVTARYEHEQQLGYNQERRVGSLHGEPNESRQQKKTFFETNCNNSTSTGAELDGRGGSKSNDSDADDKELKTVCREVRKKSSKKLRKRRKTSASVIEDRDKNSCQLADEADTIKPNSGYNSVDLHREEDPSCDRVERKRQSLNSEQTTIYLGEAQNSWQPQQSTSSNTSAHQTESHYTDLSGGFATNSRGPTSRYCENDQYCVSAGGIACDSAGDADTASLRALPNQPGSSSTCSSASPALLPATSASGSGTPASSEYNQLR